MPYAFVFTAFTDPDCNYTTYFRGYYTGEGSSLSIYAIDRLTSGYDVPANLSPLAVKFSRLNIKDGTTVEWDNGDGRIGNGELYFRVLGPDLRTKAPAYVSIVYDGVEIAAGVITYTNTTDCGGGSDEPASPTLPAAPAAPCLPAQYSPPALQVPTPCATASPTAGPGGFGNP